jgi:alkaline phosphatase/streptomycin-6-phosphatase
MRHVFFSATTLVGIFAVLAIGQLFGRFPSATKAEDADQTELVSQATIGGTARNILLFIGDGLGDAEITLARNYSVGASGRLALDTLLLSGVHTTYAVEERDPSLPVYVPDSAAAGTAWATGHKTSNGRVSTSPRDDRDLATILEMAQQRGYRTGDVTTAELTDATPAVLAAHVAHRSCQGPADMAACPQDRKSAGGPGSIAEQELAHNIDVLMGGGAARFEQQKTDDGRTPIQDAVKNGYFVIGATAGLELAKPGRKLLGLFASGNMTPVWRGEEARPYPSNVGAAQVCLEGNRPAGEPTLAQMTAKAIELLDRGDVRGPGFFLQVEGASIDKQAHAANPCGQIGETIAFDRAVKVGIDYATAHPGTLLVVTADHAHSSQIVGLPTDADHPSGLLSVLLTADHVPMTVAYGTNGYHRSQEHTGTQVRIAAMGPQAANLVGVRDQTDLFRVMLRALEGEHSAQRR